MDKQVAKFNTSVEQILKDGEAYLEDMELSEANVEQLYNEYREQVCMCVYISMMPVLCMYED